MGATTATREETAPATRRRRRAKAPAGPKTPWWMWLAVVAIILYCLFPFYWMLNISLKTGADLTAGQFYPPHPTLKNYDSIFGNADFTRALLNSAVISVATTVLALTVGSFCAYALARLRFRGKFPILALVLSITTFPAIAIAAPLFRLWSDIGIYNTWIGLIIPNLTFALPLAIYILVSFFKEIPRDLEEAALVDGATYFQAFRKVVVPLAAPGLATAAILTFIGAWNEFLLAVTLTSSSKARTVPAAIAFFTGATEHEVAFGSISAAAVVISVPLIIMVLLFQKRIVAGLTAGAVKG
jgi:trehalose/maltose transport system permease protein